jgi:hypothetical protein
MYIYNIIYSLETRDLPHVGDTLVCVKRAWLKDEFAGCDRLPVVAARPGEFVFLSWDRHPRVGLYRPVVRDRNGDAADALALVAGGIYRLEKRGAGVLSLATKLRMVAIFAVRLLGCGPVRGAVGMVVSGDGVVLGTSAFRGDAARVSGLRDIAAALDIHADRIAAADTAEVAL